MSTYAGNSDSKAVVSYNLHQNAIDYISKQAKKYRMSKSDFVVFLIEDYISKGQENENLKFYLDSAQDGDFIKSQIIESEIDLLTELKYNSYAD